MQVAPCSHMGCESMDGDQSRDTRQSTGVIKISQALIVTDHKDPAFLMPVLVQQDLVSRNGCLITDDWNRCGIIGFSVKIYYQAQKNLARIAGT